MASAQVTVSIVFENQQAAEALRTAIECLEECEDLSTWRPEIKRAIKAMRYVSKHVGVACGKQAAMFK